MKKIIAFILCGTSSCFGLNMPTALKPNVSSMSQSLSNLSFTSKAMIIAASVVSLVGIIYAAWPTSEEAALKKIKEEFIFTRDMIVHQTHMNGLSPQDIVAYFKDKKNPITFHSGPFWNRNAYQILVGVRDCKEMERNQEGQWFCESTKTVSTLEIIKKRPLQRYTLQYHADEKKWHRYFSANDKDNLDIEI